MSTRLVVYSLSKSEFLVRFADSTAGSVFPSLDAAVSHAGTMVSRKSTLTVIDETGCAQSPITVHPHGHSLSQ